MASEWRTAPLAEFVAYVTYGFTNPMPTTPDGPFMVTAKDIHDGRIDYSTARHTSVAAYRDLLTDKSRPKPGDVLLTKDGSLGRVAVVDRPDICINQSVAAIRPTYLIDSHFLRYLLESPVYQAQMAGDADGTTIRHIYITRVDKMAVAVPPIPEQRRIVGTLGALDDKIELNRRMSQTLESMARALFKSWFVDFDPVRAKAERRASGLPAHMADLFPASFEDSDIGPIPTGWGASTLGDLVEVNPSRRLRDGQLAPYLDMANAPTTGHSPDSVVDRVFRTGSRFINGDTLVARITPCLENGKASFVDFLRDGQVGWGSTEFLVLRPRSPLAPELAYCLTRSEPFRDYAIQNMSGTSGRQRVSADALSRYPLVRPPESVAVAFGGATARLLRRAKLANDESNTLSEQRDSLLVRLMLQKVA